MDFIRFIPSCKKGEGEWPRDEARIYPIHDTCMQCMSSIQY